VEKAEREAIMRHGVPRPETARDRREQAALEEDLRSLPQRGQQVSLRLRNFRPAADSYLAAARGPLAYMLRLHEIEVQIEGHEERLADAWHALAAGCDGDADRFSRDWRMTAEGWSFAEINDLIDRHNRWYPVESHLPMDPVTGDFVLVNGRHYRLAPFDADWILERFPPVLRATTAVS
jgi:hypothetical protein